jgi:hypothetical protein
MQMRRLLGLLAISFTILILIAPFIPASESTISEKTISFTDISKTDRSITLSLPKSAKVSYFSFELAGPVEPGGNQPWNLSLDIGDNGTVDWALKQEYGPMGFQNTYSSGEETITRSFLPGNYNSSSGVYLPMGAEVNSATMELFYSEEDYFSAGITELNRAEWHPEAPYDYDPEMCIYQDRLYVAYRSYNWDDTNQSDADIVINSTADGFHWQEKNIELTKSPDTEVPYLGGKLSGDFYPSLAVFKNKLYCAWESASSKPIGSTNGSDRDIVWTSFDGSHWDEPRELTAPTEYAAEDNYSENPGIKDDYRVQLCTFDNGSGEQLFAIWTANNTGDEFFPGSRKGDIIISRTVDGETWTVGQDITFNDRRYDEDYLPQLVEFETSSGNALFAFWVTNNDQVTNGSDWDIVYRYTFDGITWSPYFDLMEACGIIETGDSDSIIDEDPSVIVYNDQLYVLWRTSNPKITNGDDIDIVLAKTSDGINWSTPMEVTPSSDVLFNNRPRATVYKNKLAMLWRTVKTDDEGEIQLRTLDDSKNKWSELISVSPRGVGGNDYSPDIISFEDQLFVSWVTQDNQTTLGEDADVVIRSLIPSEDAVELALDLGFTHKKNNNWLFNKINVTTNNKWTIDLTPRLQTLIQDGNWSSSNVINDDFENNILYFPIITYLSSPGEITLRSLKIEYNYSFTVSDLSNNLNSYIKENKDENSNDDLKIPLRFDSISNGNLKVQNLKVIYTASSEPEEYPEVFCIIIIGVILIIIGVLIKIMKPKPKKGNKDSEK